MSLCLNADRGQEQPTRLAIVLARGGWGCGEGLETRSRPASTDVARPDGAQPPRVSASGPRGRETLPAPPSVASQSSLNRFGGILASDLLQKIGRASCRDRG